jgi:hypothetical protein
MIGPGRGPILRRILLAAQNTKKKIKVYAIEKNPNA